jgi:hypothetical protein
MQAAELRAERVRKNQLLAAGLFAVSLLVLGLMIAVVVGVRSGVLPRFVEQMIRLVLG